MLNEVAESGLVFGEFQQLNKHAKYILELREMHSIQKNIYEILCSWKCLKSWELLHNLRLLNILTKLYYCCIHKNIYV